MMVTGEEEVYEHTGGHGAERRGGFWIYRERVGGGGGRGFRTVTTCRVQVSWNNISAAECWVGALRGMERI